MVLELFHFLLASIKTVGMLTNPLSKKFQATLALTFYRYIVEIIDSLQKQLMI